LRSYSVRERLAGVPSGLAGWFNSIRAIEPLRYTVIVPGSGPASADVMVKAVGGGAGGGACASKSEVKARIFREYSGFLQRTS
jgi:hypothetical protein